MADPRGFLTTQRESPPRRPVDVRILDWHEVQDHLAEPAVRRQAGRCMDCGVPFCHQGCPLGNLIPEWNDLVRRGHWREASERLHATNNFPEITGRICPAPCEGACVVGIDDAPVTIKEVERAVADHARDQGWVVPHPPSWLTERTVAVVGSGPAGLTVAQQLTRAGHTVVVYERVDRIGGLLRYGIPDFKMAKGVLDRRLEQMVAEGTLFQTGVEVGVDISLADLRRRFDAVVLAIGATEPRDLPIPGRDLMGIHQAMEYLPLANRVQHGDLSSSPLEAQGRHVVIVGGGDTGVDCHGTALRQGAASVTQLDIYPQPPATRDPSTPWPTWPLLLRTAAAHEEGGERRFATGTVGFVDDGNGRVGGLRVVEVERVDGNWRQVPGSEHVLPADLVLLALGFSGPELTQVAPDGGPLATTPTGEIARDDAFATALPGVFVAGDAGRGASLVVWAIAEGRSCAAAVDRWLGGTAALPAPVHPRDRPLTA